MEASKICQNWGEGVIIYWGANGGCWKIYFSYFKNIQFAFFGINLSYLGHGAVKLSKSLHYGSESKNRFVFLSSNDVLKKIWLLEIRPKFAKLQVTTSYKSTTCGDGGEAVRFFYFRKLWGGGNKLKCLEKKLKIGNWHPSPYN